MSIEIDIGLRIKNLRNQNSLTQQELADRTELTKGYISQLERNQTVPSVATLLDILQCLGTTPSAFFEEDGRGQVVFNEIDDFFEKVDEESKSIIKWLVPNAQKNKLEPVIVELDAGGFTHIDKPHEGEEFGYVISGKISIVLGKRIYEAKAGESFYYISNEKHYIKTQDNETARFIWISTPPSF